MNPHSEKERISRIIESYRKNLNSSPIKEFSVLKFKDYPLFQDLTDEEIEISYEMKEIACFSALSKREYFKHGGYYCCSENFFIQINEFADIDSEYTTLVRRRRDGKNLDLRNMKQICFTNPNHVALNPIELDENLIFTLVKAREGLDLSEWLKWRNAIYCYNIANTDNTAIRYDLEWILYCSAIQELLNSKSEAKKIAQDFENLFSSAIHLYVKNSSRLQEILKVYRWADSKPILYVWMREFVRIRGRFAHGGLDITFPIVWKPFEHIMLATIVIPLIIKKLLSNSGYYELSDYDQAEINAFEKYADSDIQNKPELWNTIKQQEIDEILRIQRI